MYDRINLAKESTGMRLTNYEKALLSGDCGQEAKQLMEVMLKIAELNQATELVKAKHVMIGNTGMMSIGGETGINFLVRLADSGIKFKVPTYTNVISMDVEQWRKMGIPEEYAQTQLKSIEAWRKMGAILCLSCMPHLCGAIPKLGDHAAYADTAPVSFANSYFGARTNREPDVICLAAAISGRLPSFGYHLDENRLGQILVNVKARLKEEADYDALGYYIGRIARDRVPVLKNLDKEISMQALIQLGAAMAVTGTVALFHAFDITPEIKENPHLYGEKNITEEIEVTDEDIQATYRELNTTTEPKIDLVYIGCPHCTIEKLKHIADVLADKQVNKNTELWITVSSAVRELASRSGFLERIERSGAKLFTDTCAIVAPTPMLGYRNMATDSAKARVYMSDFGLDVRFGTTDQCLAAAIKGYWGE
jgi:predicted aconitase